MAEVQTQIAAATTVASSSKPSKTYGLSFRRLFTKAGISPYDEVEWEKRTATIVGPRQHEHGAPLSSGATSAGSGINAGPTASRRRSVLINQ